ncbi:MAG: T9SS type A sorting domain-containing protein [Bacteroidetes bacterium]|nr:T9SS type A sorting domain-containing protein [Bacteroidota bacterium]
MKKIYSIILLSILAISMKATSYTITISGFAYSPSTLNALVGDVITISASGSHPLAEVSQTTWNASGTTRATDIYYVCTAHASFGMKGMITVGSVGVKEETDAISNISMFPNPAKNQFSVKFNSTDNGNVTAKIYSICGQEIESLVMNKEFNAGVTTLNFDLQNRIPAGVYFVQLNYNSRKVTRKLIID